MNSEEETTSTDVREMTVEQLRKALEALGETWHPASKAPKLRNQMLTKLGMTPLHETDGPSLDATTQKGDKSPYGDMWHIIPPMFDAKKTELNPWGWNGRMYVVEVSSHVPKEKTFHVSWENFAINLNLNTRVHIPAPHWNRLQEHRTVKIEQERVVDSNGIPSFEKRYVPWSQFMVTTHGVVPGTETLPCDMRDYYRAFAKARDNFNGLKRAQLNQVHSALYPDTPPKEKREMSDDMIREEILVFLGLIADETLEKVA